jgi:RNA-directed DNA polymerase
VNQEKSQVARAEKVKFLGFTVVNGTIAIARKALQTAMDKVKALTPRGTEKRLDTTLKSINPWYVGWSNYYSLSQYPAQLGKIEAHIRRRLRARLVDQQKRRRFLYRKLINRGVSPKAAAVAFTNRKRWALSKTMAVSRAYPNKWFIEVKGQAIRSDQKLAHWFDVNQWVYLT